MAGTPHTLPFHRPGAVALQAGMPLSLAARREPVSLSPRKTGERSPNVMRCFLAMCSSSPWRAPRDRRPPRPGAAKPPPGARPGCRQSWCRGKAVRGCGVGAADRLPAGRGRRFSDASALSPAWSATGRSWTAWRKPAVSRGPGRRRVPSAGNNPFSHIVLSWRLLKASLLREPALTAGNPRQPGLQRRDKTVY